MRYHKIMDFVDVCKKGTFYHIQAEYNHLSTSVDKDTFWGTVKHVLKTCMIDGDISTYNTLVDGIIIPELYHDWKPDSGVKEVDIRKTIDEVVKQDASLYDAIKQNTC